MRFPLLATLILVLSPCSVEAQLSARISAGATMGASLVSDAILYEDVVSLRTAVAPTLAVGVSYPISSSHRLLGELRLASASLTGSGNAGSTDLGALRTIEFSVMAEGPLPYHMRFQFGGGAIKYSPARATGAFLDDAPIKPMVTAGLSWTRALRPGLDLNLGGRWGLHEFTTLTLERRGYSLAQRVHRLGLTLGLERSW